MRMLKIVRVPHPVLRKKAAPVEKIDQKILELIAAMKETLTRNRRGGVGLAAPQIGVSLRLILVKDASLIRALINPVIERSSGATEIGWEGCLSIPDAYGRVVRPRRVVVSALNPQGKKITLKGAGLLARILQHETDHLDGILFTDKLIGKPLTEKDYRQLTL